MLHSITTTARMIAHMSSRFSEESTLPDTFFTDSCIESFGFSDITFLLVNIVASFGMVETLRLPAKKRSAKRRYSYFVTGFITVRFHVPKICKWSGVP